MESPVRGIWRLRSVAESREKCEKFKTVTEIRQSSARDTFTADRVYLVLKSLWDWEPGVMWSDLRVFLFLFFSI